MKMIEKLGIKINSDRRYSAIPINQSAIQALPDLLSVLIELMACSAYWSEYDVPIGIHDRIKTAVEKATGRTADDVMEIYNA